MKKAGRSTKKKQTLVDLLLAYLPHMDYSLQRSGPGSAEARDHLAQLDELLGPLLEPVRDDPEDPFPLPGGSQAGPFEGFRRGPGRIGRRPGTGRSMRPQA